MSGIKRVSDDEHVETCIGSIMIVGESGDPVWELGKIGEGCFGFYRQTANGRMWWPLYTDTLDEAERMLRSVARTYGWKVTPRK